MNATAASYCCNSMSAMKRQVKVTPLQGASAFHRKAAAATHGPLRTFAKLAPLQRSFHKPAIGGIVQHGLARQVQLCGTKRLFAVCIRMSGLGHSLAQQGIYKRDSKHHARRTTMRKHLLALIAVLLCTSAAHAEQASQARQLLEEARLLIRNYQHESGHQILWRVFLKGERFGAKQAEIAEAANMLVSFGGTKDDKEYLYLRTWAAERGYPPAMAALATSILRDYATAKTSEELLKELLEYPKVFTEKDALAFLQRAAEQGNPDALGALAAFHKKGKNGYLADPYRAEELYTEALRRRIEIGMAGDHHELIAVARQISQQEKSLKNSEAIIKEAIEMGMKQPGGMDVSGASKIATYYGAYFLKEGAAASAQEYHWLFYAAYRAPPRLQNHYLSQLGDYFAGHTGFIRLDGDTPLDLVAAHALFNVVGSRSDAAPLARDNRDALTKQMSKAEIKLAVELARKCMGAGHRTCLDVVNQHFSKSGS